MQDSDFQDSSDYDQAAAAAQNNKGGQDKNKQNDAALDLINYKGIYFDDDTGEKYQCPDTGAHFEYYDMYRRLNRIKRERDRKDAAESKKKEYIKDAGLDKQAAPRHEVKKSQTNLRKAADFAKQI